MLDNFNAIEIAILGGLAYLIYAFAVDADGVKAEPLTAAAVGIAAFFSLDSASDTVDTFGGGTAPSGVVIANWSASELISIAAVVYAGYRAYLTGRQTAMIVAGGLALYLLFLSNKSTATF